MRKEKIKKTIVGVGEEWWQGEEREGQLQAQMTGRE